MTQARGLPDTLGTQFNVEPGSVRQSALLWKNFIFKKDLSIKVSILGYAHNSLEEPTLNALNLYANVI